MKTVVIDGVTVDMEKFIMTGVFRMMGDKKAIPSLVDGQFIFLAAKTDKETQPWRHFVYDLERYQCQKWHYVFHNVFLGDGPQVSFVPSHCQDCYKVVVKPRTWPEFMWLNDVMEGMSRHSKCGIEKRFYVQGMYGAFFYNRGLEEAHKTLEIVRDCLKGAPIILKRACTEYEIPKVRTDNTLDGSSIAHKSFYEEPLTATIKRAGSELEISEGPSDKWVVTDEQLELEEFYDKWITIIEDTTPQTKEELDKVYKYWNEFAYKWDPTYDGKPAGPQYIQY